mgnify:CR=1 FL=1
MTRPRTAADHLRYTTRRDAGLCLDCAADLRLLIAWSKTRCPECYDVNRASARAYRSRAEVMRRDAEQQRARYERAKARGTCVDCAAPPAPGRVRCQRHLEAMKVLQVGYLDRKEAADAR